jgi:hypothetical protein
MTLQPQAYFTVVRQIANHTDAGTYYVRAVIRNAFTDAIIETLDLTDKGSQRFKKDWMVPADTSGQGFYISIVTSVYTDSGYTTKSDNYGDEENTYLVQERVKPLMRGGGGISARDVRDIIKEELAKLPKPEKMEIPEFKQEKVDLSPILEELRGVGGKIKDPEKVDLAPVLADLQRAIDAIEAKEVTPETDLSPILAEMKQIQADVHTALDTFRHEMERAPIALAQMAKDEVEKGLGAVKWETTHTIGKKEEPKEEPEPFDIKQLAL